MYSVDQAVYWVIKVREDKHLERAGIIKAIVEPEQHPNDAGLGKVVANNVYIRTEFTYLVQIPNTQSIFWLSERQICPLPEEKKSLLYAQKKAQIKKEFIDKSDRIKIKRVCKHLGYDFTESSDFLHVPDMKKRFCFRVMQGVEFISYIEAIKDL